MTDNPLVRAKRAIASNLRITRKIGIADWKSAKLASCQPWEYPRQIRINLNGVDSTFIEVERDASGKTLQIGKIEVCKDHDSAINLVSTLLKSETWNRKDGQTAILFFGGKNNHYKFIPSSDKTNEQPKPVHQGFGANSDTAWAKVEYPAAFGSVMGSTQLPKEIMGLMASASAEGIPFAVYDELSAMLDWIDAANLFASQTATGDVMIQNPARLLIIVTQHTVYHVYFVGGDTILGIVEENLTNYGHSSEPNFHDIASRSPSQLHRFDENRMPESLGDIQYLDLTKTIHQGVDHLVRDAYLGHFPKANFTAIGVEHPLIPTFNGFAGSCGSIPLALVAYTY